MKKDIPCKQCGANISIYSNPYPTTDVIIYDAEYGVILIERLNAPFGYALPGGFIDEGESAEKAAIREMKEETGLDVDLCGLLGVYSDPKRDPRFHTMSIVFVGKAKDIHALSAGDDAKSASFYKLDALPDLAFDHADILQDFMQYIGGKRHLLPINKA